MKEKIKTFLLMTSGTLLMTSGIYFFKFPNNFSMGGVSGIAVILGALFPVLSPSTVVLVINMLLLIIGFIFVGKKFGIKTVYCSMLMSLTLFVAEKLLPLHAPITSQPTLELVFAIFLPAAGSAILFNISASTGGTDIVAMIIKKYTKANISKALFYADAVIVMATAFVFGIETWLYCILGFLVKVFLINTILESINMSKFCTVIVNPDCEEKVSEYIKKRLHKSATISKTYSSAFLNEPKSVLLVALKRHQAIELKRYTKTLDEKAFIIVTNTSDICGKGFREPI